MNSRLDLDSRLRGAAFEEIRRLRDRSGGVVTSAQLEAGFHFDGERIAFRNPQMGIWRPRQLGPDGAALSIVTVAPRAGRQRPYDDQIGSDADYFVYRYQGTDPDLWTNRAVRRAQELQRPLLYLYGISPVYTTLSSPASLKKTTLLRFPSTCGPAATLSGSMRPCPRSCSRYNDNTPPRR